MCERVPMVLGKALDVNDLLLVSVWVLDPNNNVI